MTSDEYVWARADDPICSKWESLGYEFVGESWGAHLLIESEFNLSTLKAKITRLENENIQFRQIALSEIVAVMELELRNFHDYPFTPATKHSLATHEELTELISESGALFGAFSESRAVGVLATRKYPEKVEFEFASVSSDYRGKGIASGLGSVAIFHYLKQGVISFATGGAAVNNSSKGTVESLGFTVDEYWRSYKPPS